MSCQECFRRCTVLPYKTTEYEVPERSYRYKALQRQPTNNIYITAHKVAQWRIIVRKTREICLSGTGRICFFFSFASFLFSLQERLAGHRERKECDNAIGPYFFLVGEAERRGAKVSRLNENPVCFMQCDKKSQ